MRLVYRFSLLPFLQDKHPSSPVFSLGQRRVVVLVEVGEGRLRGLEEREALNAAENTDADPSARLPLALAAPEHEVRPALEEGVVVLSGLAGAVCRQHSVPSVLLHHHPTPVDQVRVRGQKVPAGGEGGREGERELTGELTLMN